MSWLFHTRGPSVPPGVCARNTCDDNPTDCSTRAAKHHVKHTDRQTDGTAVQLGAPVAFERPIRTELSLTSVRALPQKSGGQQRRDQAHGPPINQTFSLLFMTFQSTHRNIGSGGTCEGGPLQQLQAPLCHLIRSASAPAAHVHAPRKPSHASVQPTHHLELPCVHAYPAARFCKPCPISQPIGW